MFWNFSFTNTLFRKTIRIVLYYYNIGNFKSLFSQECSLKITIETGKQ